MVRPWRAALAVGAVAGLVVTSLFVRTGGVRPMAFIVAGGVAAAVILLVLLLISTPEETEGSVWDAIPRWQYGGRHVESGGLARDEQEQALRDLEREAAELEAHEESHRDRDP